MFSKLKILGDLATPQYLLIALVTPFSAYLLINNAFPSVGLLPIVLSFGFAILGFNIFNQVSDIKIDKVNKPFRPIIAKKISKKSALLISACFYVMSIIIAFLTNALFFYLIILFAIISLFYCYPKANIKRFFWSSSVIGMALYGVIPFFAVYSISTKPLPIIFLFFFTAMIGIYSNVKDFEDMVGEKEFKINSLSIMLGLETAARLVQVLMFLLLLLFALFSLGGIINPKYFIASVISLAFFLASSKLFWKEVLHIKYKNITFQQFNHKEATDIVTQSDAVTLITILGLLIQLIYGFFALQII